MRRHRRRWTALVAAVTGLAMFAVSAGALTYQDLQGNIETQDIEPLLGTDRPRAPSPDPEDPSAGQPLNVLLVGVDDRDGANSRFGSAGQTGVRSDTVILAHVSADRSRVELVSIPRDSWVAIPSCVLPDGTETAPTEFKFNQAFALGGATGSVAHGVACSIRTLEQLTDVRIDGFVAVDFTGFIDMVDAIGGVPICVEQPIDDDDADVRLDAGYQVLDGEEALGFARARKSLGNGSDTDRIGRQQQLLGAVVATLLDKDLLTDTATLYRFLDAATASLTTSAELGSITSLAGLALSLRDVAGEDVRFVTVPWTPRGDGANVVWTSEADALWAAVAADTPIPGAEPETPDGTDLGDTDPGDTPTTTPPSGDPSPSLGADPDTESEVCG